MIELLVVVAIIAVLIAILLPSLRKAKEKSQATACGSNLRQLAMAWGMYAHENSDRLCSPSTYRSIPEVTNPAQVYVPWWSAYYVGPYFNNRTIGVTNMGDGGRPRAKVLFCPAQATETLDPRPTNGRYGSALGFNGTPNCNLSPASGGARWSEVASPTKMILMLDTNASYTWGNNGNWYQPPGSPTVTVQSSYTYPISSSAGFRHGNVCNVVFFDTHVESIPNATTMAPTVRNDGRDQGLDLAYVNRLVTNNAKSAP